MEKRGSLKMEDKRDEPSAAELVVMAISALFTLALLGYMLYQALALPAHVDPRAELLGTQTTPEGDVLVHVAFVNEGSRGLREGEVEVKCGEQPPALTFQNVPAHSRRDGVAICPPGTTAPEVGVTYWIHA